MIRFCSSGTGRGADLDTEIAARDHDRVGVSRGSSSSASTASAFSIFAITSRVRAGLLGSDRLQVADVGAARADERQRDEVDAELERELEVVRCPSASATGSARDAGKVDALVRADDAADDDARSARGPL